MLPFLYNFPRCFCSRNPLVTLIKNHNLNLSVFKEKNIVISFLLDQTKLLKVTLWISYATLIKASLEITSTVPLKNTVQYAMQRSTTKREDYYQKDGREAPCQGTKYNMATYSQFDPEDSSWPYSFRCFVQFEIFDILQNVVVELIFWFTIYVTYFFLRLKTLLNFKSCLQGK